MGSKWKPSGSARAAGGPYTEYFFEKPTNDNLVSTRLAHRRWWGISVCFAEAAALPCVQNMRGASDIILSLIIGLIRLVFIMVITIIIILNIIIIII